MDAPDPSSSDRPTGGVPTEPGKEPGSAEFAGTEPQSAEPTSAWVAALPPPPFIDPVSSADRPRIAPLSPRVAVLIGAAILIGILLWMARDSIRPFVVGLLLVYLLEPPVRWLVRRGVNRALAILIVYVLAFVAFVEFLNLTLTPLVNELLQFIDELPELLSQLQDQAERLTEFYARLQIPDAIRDWIDSMIAAPGAEGPPAFDVTALLQVVTGAGSLVGGLFGYLLLPVWAFYLLKDRVALTQSFDRSLPAAWRFDTWALIGIVRRVFGQWVRAQLLLGIVVGVTTFVGLLLLSVTVDPVFGRYALLLSVVAGLLELVPIIGPIIAAVPAVLLALTASVEAVIAALVLYTLIQQVENNLLVPKIQGDATEMHPAAVIFALVVGGALAGLLGAILALPISAALRDVIRYLFRRLTPNATEPLAASLKGLHLDDRLRDAAVAGRVATDPVPAAGKP